MARCRPPSRSRVPVQDPDWCETAQATSQVRHPIQRLGSAITKLFIERDPKWFVTPDRPHPPGRRQRGLPPQSIYQTNTGRWPVIKSQAYENKEIIWMIKEVLVATDEGNEGASPLLDMTKVTRSTLADKLLPRFISVGCLAYK